MMKRSFRPSSKLVLVFLFTCLMGLLFVASAQAELGGKLLPLGTDPNTDCDVMWSLDNDGKLTIYPANGVSGQIKTQFRNDKKQTELEHQQLWPWENYRSQITSIEVKGTITTYGERIFNGMFENCVNLTEVAQGDIFRAADDPNGAGLVTSRVMELNDMFTGCSSLVSADLSGMTFKYETGKKPLYSMNRLFADCSSLQNVSVNFESADACQTITTGVQIKDMFRGCSNLETVELRNATFAKHSSQSQDTGLWVSSKLTTLDLRGATLYGMDVGNISESAGFPTEGLFTLEADDGYEDMTGNARQIIEMNLNGTQAEPGRYVPGLYTKISDTSNDFTYVPQTTYLVNNIDNSMPYMQIPDPDNEGQWLTIALDSSGESTAIAVFRNGRRVEEFGKTYYCSGTMPIGGYVFSLDSHGESGFYRIRVFTEDLNGLGSGRVQEGTPDSDGVYDGTYDVGPLRIVYPDAATDFDGNTKDVIVTIDGITFHDLQRVPDTTSPDYPKGSGLANPWYTGIYTQDDVSKQWGYSDNEGFHPLMYIDPEDGQEKPVNAERVYNRSDYEKIPGYNGNPYYRYLFAAEQGQLNFWNQIRKSADPHDSENNNFNVDNLYSKGSGTWIDYTIEIKDAPAGSTFLYSIEDLDLTSDEEWLMDLSDSEKDQLLKLIWDNGTQGGGEGVILGSGNDLRTISLATYSGLRLLNGEDTRGGAGTQNYVVGTGYDPGTSWSRFYVRSDAQGSSYTWTSGTSCKTTMLKTVEGANLLSVYLIPTAQKLINDEIPTGQYDGAFTFSLKAASIDLPADPETSLDNLARDPVNPTALNQEGSIVFSDMEFMCNEGEAVYIYKITEQIGTDSQVVYNVDDVTYYLRVFVPGATGDSSQTGNGVKIDVSIGTRYGNGAITWGASTPVYSAEAQPAYLTADGVPYYCKAATLATNQYYSGKDGEWLIVGTTFNPQYTDQRYTKEVNGVTYPVYVHDTTNEGQRDFYLFYIRDGHLYNIDDDTEITDNPTVVHIGQFRNKDGFTIRKLWDDSDNVGEHRPESIIVTLYQDHHKFKDFELSESNDWKVNISGAEAPKYSEDGSHEYIYQVYEDSIEDYTPYQYEDEPYVITNRYTPDPEITYMAVVMAWDDLNDIAGIRPNEVIMKLLANGNPAMDLMGQQIPGIEMDGHATVPHYWYNLPVYDEEGKKIKYSVEQIVTFPENTYTTDLIIGDSGHLYHFTNIYRPETIDLTISKHWEDGENEQGLRPEDVEFHVHVNGKHEDKYVAVLNESNKWTVTFSDLLKYYAGKEIVYSVVEAEIVDNYQVSLAREGTEHIYTVTNELTPGLTTVEVDMDWEDYNNQDGIRPEYVTVRLYANGVDTGKYLHLTGYEEFPSFFPNLDVYDEDGYRIIYSVVQDPVAGYTTTVKQVSHHVFHILNEHIPEKLNVTVTKTWDDNENIDKKRPHQVIVRLRADGLNVAEGVLRLENNWTYTFANQNKMRNGKVIDYTVSEDRVRDYTTLYDESEGTEDVTITNAYTPGQTSITVVKRWDDNNNADGKRPDHVTVNLLANGQDTGRKLYLNAENHWGGDFIGIPEYQDGQAIHYVVLEEPVDGYTVNYAGNMDEGYVVINTLRKELKVIYTSDEGGTILGIDSEMVSHGMSPSGTSHRANTGYSTLGWTANRDVLLRDGTFIPAGTYMTDEQIRQIIVTEDLILTVHHQQKPDHDDFSPFIDRYYSSRFTFTKQWIGEHGDSIEWTLYAPDGSIAHKGFNKYVRNEDEWYYEAWFDDCTGYYLVEKVPAGFSVRYENIAPYEDVTDRCYRGGRIINYKPPKTGDSFNPVLWWTLSALALLGITCTALLSVRKRRRVK